MSSTDGKYILNLRSGHSEWKEKVEEGFKREKKQWNIIICLCGKLDRETHRKNKDEYDEVKGLSVRHIHIYTFV